MLQLWFESGERDRWGNDRRRKVFEFVLAAYTIVINKHAEVNGTNNLPLM